MQSILSATNMAKPQWQSPLLIASLRGVGPHLTSEWSSINLNLFAKVHMNNFLPAFRIYFSLRLSLCMCVCAFYVKVREQSVSVKYLCGACNSSLPGSLGNTTSGYRLQFYDAITLFLFRRHLFQHSFHTFKMKNHFCFTFPLKDMRETVKFLIYLLFDYL